MKKKRIVHGRKICEKKKRIKSFAEGLRKRFKELEREEEEFRITVLNKVRVSSQKKS